MREPFAAQRLSARGHLVAMSLATALAMAACHKAFACSRVEAEATFVSEGGCVSSIGSQYGCAEMSQNPCPAGTSLDTSGAEQRVLSWHILIPLRTLNFNTNTAPQQPPPVSFSNEASTLSITRPGCLYLLSQRGG